MILYVNGDSHSAGAEAVGPWCFKEDDTLFYSVAGTPAGREPHPVNLAASYGALLSNHLSYNLICDAQSAASNERIFRTAEDYLKSHTPDLVIIGWTTWEREEWLHHGTYYQVTASGADSVPPELADRYRQWVVDQTNETKDYKARVTGQRIWELHTELLTRKIPHLFFNTYLPLPPLNLDFGEHYIDPYTDDGTYFEILRKQGFKPINDFSYHYGADGHIYWAELLLNHLTNYQKIAKIIE